jgi:hypothetical protein
MQRRPQQQTEETVTTPRAAFPYIDSAPHDEVMMEQLEYLLMHSRSGFHEQCADCKRLDNIYRYLLQPFC